jgi:formylglycine-generating enzyme required for sulfatase activity
VIGARVALVVFAATLGGCWLTLDLEDKQFDLEPGAGGAGGSAANAGGAGPHDGMVRITLPDQSAFYVDATEVTVADYAAWLATSPPVSQQASRCAWNQSFEPGVCTPGAPCNCEGTGVTLAAELAISEQLPVRCVDFCDAVAYCAGVGKHLCGGIHNLVLAGDPTSSNDPAQSEWFNACSNGGTRALPYGNQFAPQTCEDANGGFNDRPRDVGNGSCEGGPVGVFDMSGNVEEWIDHCYVGMNDTQACFRPGGAYWHGEEDWLDCDIDWPQSTDAREQSPATGFRCCDDP